MVKSLFRYCGGKAKQTGLLKSYFPSGYAEYRECFCGGGSLYFCIDPSKTRWINDANASLMSVYLALRDRPEQFIKACRQIQPANPSEAVVLSSRGTPYNQRLSERFHAMLGDDSMDLALRYYFLNRCGFNGRVLLDPQSRSRMYFSNPAGWDIVKGDVLETATKALRGTKITTGDYSTLLSAPGNDVVVYADPPYWRDTTLPKSGKLYEIGFVEADHVRFRDAVLNSPHRVVVSYDDCEFIRSLWTGFHLNEASWNYAGTVGQRRQGKELIITNFRSATVTVCSLVQAA